MSHEALPLPPYPDIANVVEVAGDTVQTRLLTNTCVVEYLAGGHRWPMAQLGAIAGADVQLWPVLERPRVAGAVAELNEAFERGLANRLAAVTSLSQGLGPAAGAAKAGRLTAAWESLRGHVGTGTDTPSAKGYDALARTLLYIDLRALGEDPPSYQSQPRGESLFRETILAGRSSGIRLLDAHFVAAYDHVILGVHSRPIAMVKQAWERHNLGHTFEPALHRQHRKTGLGDTILRQFIQLGSSFVWWTAYADREALDRAERAKNL